MFVILDLLVFGLLAFGLFILVTQVIIPGVKGSKLFPNFRANPLREEVEATKDVVETMRDQNASLRELGPLLKERSELEKKISAAKNDVAPTQENK